LSAHRAVDVVGLDADDTLWHCEDGFNRAIDEFVEVLAPSSALGDAEHIREALDRTERLNLPLFGYGVKAFTIAMIEAAAMISDDRLTARMVDQVVDIGKRLFAEPVVLIDGVAEVVARLAPDYRLVMITKGDLLHQERKISESGLARHFDAIEVISEKDPATYRRVLHELRIDPAGFVMVGNSVRSDVLPVLSIGARAVHVPYEVVWAHEVAVHDGSVPELASIRELPAWLRDGDAR
jgi:putative hydrolase of the HAD superfamily